jgi:hypothetical protein
MGPTGQSHGPVVRGVVLPIIMGLRHPLVCVGIHPGMVYLLCSFGRAGHYRDSSVKALRTRVYCPTSE